MIEAKDNPPANFLGAGVKEEELAAAVAKSGHPMQARVARQVRNSFQQWGKDEESYLHFIQEEWTYEDAESGDVRALDAFAELWLWGDNDEQPRIRPTLNILIECKQSELPYVFFTRSAEHGVAEYPYTQGFPHAEITLSTNDDPSTFTYRLLDILGLADHAFLHTAPVAVSLSKVRRKGSQLEITGEDSYNSLTLPLLKARDHLLRIAEYRNTHFTDGRLITAVAVVNAPMIAVDEDGEGGLEAVPWVRVHRYEPQYVDRRVRTHSLAAYDVVHEHYLPEYLAQLNAFAETFATAVSVRQQVLLEGLGFAPELGHGAGLDEVRPRTSSTRLLSLRLAGESIWSYLRRATPAYGRYIRRPLGIKRRRDR